MFSGKGVHMRAGKDDWESSGNVGDMDNVDYKRPDKSGYKGSDKAD